MTRGNPYDLRLHDTDRILVTYENAMLVRNRYGAECLTSNNVLIADVDLPSWGKRIMKSIFWWLLNLWVSDHPSWLIRVYETRRGYRLIVTHQEYQLPQDTKEVAAFFRATVTDNAYTELCMAQRGFRARVSPKPWRVGVKEVYTSENADAWVRYYHIASTGFASARYLRSVGNGFCSPNLRSFVQVHDELSRALEEDKPLA